MIKEMTEEISKCGRTLCRRIPGKFCRHPAFEEEDGSLLLACVLPVRAPSQAGRTARAGWGK